MDVFLIGLLTALFGLLLAFSGYQFFRVLIPIWGFFAGFTWGAQALAIGLGTGFLATATGWIVGLVIGLVMAGLAYFLYEFAVALLGASIGYYIVMALLAPLGMTGFFATMLAIIAAVGAGAAVYYYRAPKGLLILFSAFIGATATIGGTLVMFGMVPPAVLGSNIINAIISQSFFWTISWLALAGFGIASQYQLSRSMSTVDPVEYYAMDQSGASLAGAKGGSTTISDEPVDEMAYEEDAVEEKPVAKVTRVEEEDETEQNPKNPA